ncbi:uncharacterized protein LOC108596368 [Drosophila busckii]|uniref:uncharacterized protein LOC108596368 n=1 Tax=Drosophila busckii TaxID=30019 RepID=UPI00083EE3A6|nr:uncharacterized protein LOC108596368 [Drosophila busckii]
MLPAMTEPRTSSAFKSTAPAKPLRTSKLQQQPPPQQRQIKGTPTSIMCELMRLKAQQKYLECNQVKLNANNFVDSEESTVEAENKVVSLINDIERLKHELNSKLQQQLAEKRAQLQDMWHMMHTLKQDVFQPERLSLYSVNAVRERIMGLNAQLQRLGVQNAKELASLSVEYEQMEREQTFVWKEAF